MAVAIALPRSVEHDSWRLPGCGEHCVLHLVTFRGRAYAEGLVSHDPIAHEAYGQGAIGRNYRVLSSETIRTGNLTLDGMAQRASVDGHSVSLPPMETRLLFYLAQNLGSLCSHGEILHAVWGPEYAPETPARWSPSTMLERHLLRVAMSRLRRQLGSAASLIETAKARGYLLRAEAPRGAGAIEEVR